MVNETAVRCFLTLAKTLSFTETARLNYMTQQSVSKYIAKLEGDLGYPLFIRTHHYVMLTKAGENFYQLFQSFEDAFHQTAEETRQFYQKKSGSLRVGYLEWLNLQEPIQQAIAAVQEENPVLQCSGERRSQYELNKLFLDQGLDLIITYPDLAPKISGLKRSKFLETPMVLLTAPNHPKAVEGATAEDFRGETFIRVAAFRESPNESRTRARRQLRELGLTPGDIVISPNVESAYMAVEFGHGVLVSTELSHNSLGGRLKSFPLGKMDSLICCWKESQENPAVAAFAAALENIKLTNDK